LHYDDDDDGDVLLQILCVEVLLVQNYALQGIKITIFIALQLVQVEMIPDKLQNTK